MSTTTSVDFTTLDDARPGDQILVRFRKEALPDLGYLETMARDGYIEMKPSVHALQRAVRSSGSWGRDENRDFTVTVTEKFSREFFEERMRRAIESLELDHLVANST